MNLVDNIDFLALIYYKLNMCNTLSFRLTCKLWYNIVNNSLSNELLTNKFKEIYIRIPRPKGTLHINPYHWVVLWTRARRTRSMINV